MIAAPINGRPFASTADGSTLLLYGPPLAPMFVAASTLLVDAGAHSLWYYQTLAALNLTSTEAGRVSGAWSLSGVMILTEPPIIPPPIIIPSAGRSAQSLGCGTYEVFFFPRGGGESAVGSLPFTSLDWNRGIDSVSDATFKLTGLTGGSRRRAACCSLFGEIDAWSHELVLVRDDVVVWAGPITTLGVQGEDATVTARDLAQWFYRRRLRADHAFDNVDLSVIFQAYVDDALSLDNSMLISLTASPCGVLGTRSTLALQNLYCGDQLDELSTTGIDWTVIGRSILVGGAVVPAPLYATPPLLTDESFATPPLVNRDGMGMATDWLVRGAGGGDGPDSIYAEAGGVDPTYGLVDQVVTYDAILDLTSAAAAATTLRALAGAPVSTISDGQLSPDAGVTMAELIPGVIFSVRLSETCLPVQSASRLAGVTVSVSADADEQVSVTFQPEGTL